MFDLSVVLISRNQEWNIARLIESVLDGTSRIPSRDIILVDSASMDKTIEIASRYPINILRLRPDQPLTPAAGRFVGFKHTSGDLVLFLDGDMELCNGWMERALTLFENRPDVAVVTGPWINLPMSTNHNDKVNSNFLKYEYNDKQGLQLGGAAMYRRSVLDQVGSFNPYLHSEEEPELFLRIRNAGYHIFRLEHPIAYHYTDPIENITTLVGRWRRNLWLGIGQSMRYHIGTELFLPYARERGYGCFPGLVLAVGFAGFLYSLVSCQWMLFGFWMLLVVTTILGYVCQKRSLYRTVYSLFLRLFSIDGTVRGFLITPEDPKNYPAKLDVIKLVN